MIDTTNLINILNKRYTNSSVREFINYYNFHKVNGSKDELNKLLKESQIKNILLLKPNLDVIRRFWAQGYTSARRKAIFYIHSLKLTELNEETDYNLFIRKQFNMTTTEFEKMVIEEDKKDNLELWTIL